MIFPVRHPLWQHPAPLDASDARAAVRAGRLHGASLLDALELVPFAERDAWLDALLALPSELPADLPGLPLSTVPYLPCSVDAIVHALRCAPLRPDDVFVDLGAGLGRPTLLAHLLSGARAIGVELQPQLLALAREAAASLGLRDRVTFMAGDAAALDIPDGTVYFMYSPFNGATLRQVMTRLERIAARHPIVICAVDFELGDQPWLRARPSSPRTEVILYDSKKPSETLQRNSQRLCREVP